MLGRSLREQQDRVGEREWCEGVDRLAVESERQLAGAQHAHPRGGGDQAGDEVGDGVHDLLAVVEDEQQVRPAQVIDHRDVRARVDVERLGDRGQDRCRVPCSLEANEACPVGSVDDGGDLDGETGLADAGGTDQRHQALLRRALAHRSQVGVAAGHRRGESRKVTDDDGVHVVRSDDPVPSRTGSWSRTWCSRARSAGPGSSPSCSASAVAHAGVGAQRVGLAAAAVEGGDERGPQPLAQGVTVDQGFELGDDLAAAAEIEPRRELVLDETEPGLFEADTVRGDPLAVAGVGENVTVEHRQRRGAQGERRRRIATGPQPRRLAGQAEHVEGIDRCGLDVQHVPGSRPGDERSVAERPSQPRDLGLQRVASRCSPPPRPTGPRSAAPCGP